MTKGKKIGRPYVGSGERSETIRLRMEPSEVEQLDQLAEQLHTTRSGAIREGLTITRQRLDAVSRLVNFQPTNRALFIAAYLEDLALDYHRRNPDLTLDQCFDKVKQLWEGILTEIKGGDQT